MTGTSEPTAHYHDRDGVAVIQLDHAPVNALAYSLRKALIKGLDRATQDPRIRAIVLIGAHGVFCGGADLRQLDTPVYWQFPRTIELASRIDAIAKPVIAAIGGLAMGGGLELALGCHFRIAHPDARLALPEIRLGLIPGGGGTLRLPRLIGPERALELMLTGNTIDGREAVALGLVDALADGELLDTAVEFAREQATRLRAGMAEPRRAIDLPVDASRARIALDDARRRLAGAPDRGRAPTVLIDCVEAGLFQPRDVALEITGQATRERMASAEAGAYRYQFFAQREAARLEGFDARRSLPISSVCVVADRGLEVLSPVVERLGNTDCQCRLVDPAASGQASGVDFARDPAHEIVLVAIEGPREEALSRLGELDRLWPDGVPFVLVLRDGPFGAVELPVQPRRPIAGLRPPRDAAARVAEMVALRPGSEPLLGALARLFRQAGWQPIQTRDGARSIAGTLAALVARDGAPTPDGGERWPAELLAALRAAGRQLLEEGQVLRLSDIDVALVSDFGFPAHRGGPFHLEGRSAD